MEKAFLIVDMVNGFAEKGYDGNMYCSNAEKIKENVKGLIKYAQKEGALVIYCCDAHEKSDPELKRNGGPWEDHCMKGSESSKIVGWLPAGKLQYLTNWKKPGYLGFGGDVQKGVPIRIDKRTYSPFIGTGLEDVLKDKNIGEVYIAGLVTSICVQHTAADAFFRGYRIKIAEDCCADINEENHRKAIDYMKNNYSADIVRLEQGKPAPHKTVLEEVL